MNLQESVLSSGTRLTQQLKAGGCASKLQPGSLRAVLDSLFAQTDCNLLVGFDQSDAGKPEIILRGDR